jgi:hypothetical protein
MAVLNIQSLQPCVPTAHSKNPLAIMHYFNWNNDDSSLILDKSEYEIYKNLIKDLLNKPSEVKFGEKIYLGKLSNLPRHKTKEYFQINKLNKTSRLEQSDTIIFHKQYLKELGDIFNINNNKKFNTLYLNKIYLFEPEDTDFIVKHTQHYRDLNNKLPFCLLINNDNQKSVTPKLTNFLQGKTSKELYYKSLYRESNMIELISYLEYILKNPHVNIVFDDDLLEPLNEDGFELDDEYLSTLDDMFNSKSQDNINLALEMLSNVNIEKHSLTIALFLNKHRNKFAWGSGLSITQNNSFKSTLKYFKSKNINFESDWRSFSTNLYNLHKDNPENVAILKGFIQQNINQYLKEFNPNNFMEIELSSLAFKG